MADRYWVGGSGTWDATTTTNWSATSGGAGGASAPTSVDNVFFNTASNATAYAVTVGTNANAQDITIASPASGAVTITMGATSVINCYSNWANGSSVLFNVTVGGTLNFLSSTTGKTVLTNGASLSNLQIIFNSATGGWSLASALTTTNNVIVTAGSFSTSASSYALTAGQLASNNANVRSILLNASTVTLSGATVLNFGTATNLTFDAGTSTINVTPASATFNGGAQTFYNVTFSSTAAGTTTLSGANTFNVFTQVSPASAALRILSIGNNQTIQTLTLGSSSSAVTRIFARTSATGTQYTLTVNTLTAISDIDFRDIVAAGASAVSPWNGTRLGDCKNNSNITFDAATTKYWSTASGASNNWSGISWATSSGGAAAINNFPLAQDTCIIDDAGATTGNGLRIGANIAIDTSWNIGTLDLSGRTAAFTWTQGNSDPTFYGDVTLTSAMTMATVSGSPTWSFRGQGTTQTLDSAGLIIRMSSMLVDSPGGTVILASNIAVDLSPIIAPNVTGLVSVISGTLDFNNNTVTSVTFTSTATTARTLAFGSTGKVVLTGSGGTVWSTSTATNLTVTGTNPLIQLTANATTGSRGVTMGAAGEANAISVDVTAGSDTIGFGTTNGSFKNVNFTGFTGTVTPSNSILVFGDWDFGGVTATAGTGGVTFAATSGIKTITSNGVSFPANVSFNGVGGSWTLQDDLTIPSTNTTNLLAGTLDLNGYTLTAGLFGSSVSTARSIAFGTGKIVLTATTGSVLSMSTVTNFTYTGTSRIEVTSASGAGRTIIPPAINATESNVLNIYVTTGSDALLVSGAARFLDFDLTGFSGALSYASNARYYGDLVFSNEMTLGSIGSTGFVFSKTSGIQTVTTAGKVIANNVGIDSSGTIVSLQDALTLNSTGTISLYAGTLTTNGYAVTAGKFGGNLATGDRTLNLGSSLITCLGQTNTTSSWQVEDLGFAYTVNAGTSTIYMTEAFTGTSQQIFFGGGKTYYNVVYSGGQPGGFYGSNTFNSISNTVQPLDLVFEAGTTQTVKDFNVSGTSGNLVTLTSTIPGSQWSIAKSTGNNKVVSYFSIADSAAIPAGYWFAPISQGNVNAGNNTGWSFGEPVLMGGFMNFLVS